jgi:hypothetical protein
MYLSNSAQALESVLLDFVVARSARLADDSHDVVTLCIYFKVLVCEFKRVTEGLGGSQLDGEIL